MPEPFTKHIGTAAVLLRDNIDTDQIIPSREMKTVSRDGLSEGLFAGWRYSDQTARLEDPNFILNQPEGRHATILVAGENFGCGSSREHAVWALQEFGIRAIIAKSFGEIFYGNCVRNGVLPVALGTELVDQLAGGDAAFRMQIDLEEQRVSSPILSGGTVQFAIDGYAKRLLSQGLDPIELTLTASDTIDLFITRDKEKRPWVYSAA